PLGPTTATTSRGATDSDRSASAMTGPKARCMRVSWTPPSTCIAPSAGITPQVRRVRSGPRTYLSRPSRQHPCDQMRRMLRDSLRQRPLVRARVRDRRAQPGQRVDAGELDARANRVLTLEAERVAPVLQRAQHGGIDACVLDLERRRAQVVKPLRVDGVGEVLPEVDGVE